MADTDGIGKLLDRAQEVDVCPNCGGREPIDTDYEAVLWHDYDDLYHLDTNLSKHLPSLLPRQKVKVHVIILPEPQGE